jgi:hypothetical protein
MSSAASDDLRLLEILAGCPDGATTHNLTQNHDITPASIYRVIERGQAQPQERVIRPPYGYRIIWLRITLAGRNAITPIKTKLAS